LRPRSAASRGAGTVRPLGPDRRRGIPRSGALGVEAQDGQRDPDPEEAEDQVHPGEEPDTDPEGEIQQGAFQAGFIRTDGFSFLLFVIVQFHLGIKVTPIAEAQTGLFDVRKVLRAAERGAACRDDLSARWDHWAWVEMPLEEARDRLGIPPLPA
jgi:hypothetical protein